jgi:hypothetical protein
VRAGQYWRVENVKSFDEFLERRFPGSRRKANYLMSIHENLPPEVRKELKEVGWAKGLELAKLAKKEKKHFKSLSDHLKTGQRRSGQNRPMRVAGTGLFYSADCFGGKFVFVRQLRGPHLSTCP